MGTGISRSFEPAGNPGRPANARRSNPLLTFLGIAAAFSLSAFYACSREAPAHVGDWSGQLYFKDFSNPLEVGFRFHADGRVEYRLAPSPGATERREGRFRFEYDNVPPRLHIEFSDRTSLNGLVAYFGREKTIMYIGVVTDGTPSQFSETKSYFFLTANDRNGRAAPE